MINNKTNTILNTNTEQYYNKLLTIQKNLYKYEETNMTKTIKTLKPTIHLTAFIAYLLTIFYSYV